MKTSMKLLLVLISATALSSMSCAFAAGTCKPEDDAMKACVKQYLIDTKIIIGGVISDPGGTATKEANASCEADCNMKRPEFDKKYRK